MKCFRTCRNIVSAVGVAACLGPGSAAAYVAGKDTDFTALSLEELGAQNVYSADVLTSHVHDSGDWMFGYHYMFMDMDGSRVDDSRVSDAEIVSPTGFGYLVTPLWMTMEMHMFHVMHAPADDLTLMAMVSYDKKTMKHVTRTGVHFTTQATGWGDLRLSANYRFGSREFDWGEQRWFGTIGFSVPTGSIDEKDVLPTGRARLPYPMQLGSGTWDLVAGLGTDAFTSRWHWGAQVQVRTPLESENDNDYRLGNRVQAAGWASRALDDELSLSARINGDVVRDIRGADPQLNPAVVPTADPDLRGGKTLTLTVGLNWRPGYGSLQGHALNVEWGRPVYQNLDGPQLETDQVLNLGWSYVY